MAPCPWGINDGVHSYANAWACGVNCPTVLRMFSPTAVTREFPRRVNRE